MLIKINRKSIKKNPNAGNTTYHMPLGPTEYHKTVINTKQYVSNNGIDYLLVADNTETKLSLSQPVQTIHTLSPEPDWLYKYEDPEVECKECGNKFKHSELKDESHEYIDEDGFDNWGEIKNVCPICDTQECCDVKFEKIEDIIREQKCYD